MKFIPRITRMSVVPEDQSIFHDLVTHVKIDDEAAGEFIVVEQECGFIKFDVAEWPAIRETIEKMISNCRDIP
jgi:hypothetical protein